MCSFVCCLIYCTTFKKKIQTSSVQFLGLLPLTATLHYILICEGFTFLSILIYVFCKYRTHSEQCRWASRQTRRQALSFSGDSLSLSPRPGLCTYTLPGMNGRPSRWPSLWKLGPWAHPMKPACLARRARQGFISNKVLAASPVMISWGCWEEILFTGNILIRI